MNIEEIMKTIPHRYPFLLVDRIIEKNEKRVVGIKNVTINEPFFQGHFPGHPIMPGVLILEAMAQVAGTLVLANPANKGKMAYFMGIDKAKFRKPVVPGDTIRFEVDVLRSKTKICQVKAAAKVDNELVTEAELLFGVVEVEK